MRSELLAAVCQESGALGRQLQEVRCDLHALVQRLGVTPDGSGRMTPPDMEARESFRETVYGEMEQDKPPGTCRFSALHEAPELANVSMSVKVLGRTSLSAQPASPCRDGELDREATRHSDPTGMSQQVAQTAAVRDTDRADSGSLSAKSGSDHADSGEEDFAVKAGQQPSKGIHGVRLPWQRVGNAPHIVVPQAPTQPPPVLPEEVSVEQEETHLGSDDEVIVTSRSGEPAPFVPMEVAKLPMAIFSRTGSGTRMQSRSQEKCGQNWSSEGHDVSSAGGPEVYKKDEESASDVKHMSTSCGLGWIEYRSNCEQIIDMSTASSLGADLSHKHKTRTFTDFTGVVTGEPKQQKGKNTSVQSGRTPTWASMDSKTSNASSSKKFVSCEALRQQNEQAIVKELQEGRCTGFARIAEDQDEPTVKASKIECVATWCFTRLKELTDLVPRFCGMLPWSSHYLWRSWVYQVACVFIGFCCFIFSSWQMYKCEPGRHEQLIMSLDVINMMGCFCGLLSCNILKSSPALLSAEKSLNAYTLQHDLVLPWGKWSSRDLLITFLLWITIAVSRGMFSDTQDRIEYIIEVAAFDFAAAVNMGMVCYCLHVCRGLMVIVDTFCHCVVDHRDFSAGVREWNTLLAVCRSVCGAIQGCLVVLLIVATLAMLTVMLDVSYERELALRLVPGLVLAVATFRISVWAASVTDKCARVPLLVNSIQAPAGLDLDADRMYAVQYIVQSQAGFYVFEMRLTCSTLMKALYFACAVTIGVATQLDPSN